MVDTLSLISVYLEVVLLVMACVIALADLFDKSKDHKIAYGFSCWTLLVLLVLSGAMAVTGKTVYGFSGLVVSDPLSNWLKCFSSATVLAVFVYSQRTSSTQGILRGGEWYTLSFFSLLGGFVMISSNNLLLVYLGLECMTLSGYGLVALRRDSQISVEAAMKYFVLGALASGFLLYGMSMLYGATGSLEIPRIFDAISSGNMSYKVLILGLVFIVSGLAFKLGAVPFHMWVPDIYQGAPASVALMIASAPKLAAFAMAIRLLVEGMLPLARDWQQMLAFLAVASLSIGNLTAVVQTNFRRMLAYSTMSHMGFVLLGMMSGVMSGGISGNGVAAVNAYGASMFYVVTYVLTTLVAFGVVILLSREGFECESISDLAGLNGKNPLYAAIMAGCMFSMAGLPPLVGFQAKLSILQALLSNGLQSHVVLAVFAVLMSLVGAFYYIRVVKVMYFDSPAYEFEASDSRAANVVMYVNGGAILFFGLFPAGLMALCFNAIAQMMLF